MRGLWPRLVFPTLGLWVGCGSRPAPPAPAQAPVPLSVRKAEAGTRVYSADEELSPASFPFEGAAGYLRVTIEITTADGSSSAAPILLDVLFHAVGDGRISIGFRNPSPGHHEGRVTIRCVSGTEESEAEFEPEIWLSHPSAIVTFEPAPREPSTAVVEGREVVLARYVARNIPSDIRLTLKAVFSRNPIGPRVKPGARPPP